MKRLELRIENDLYAGLEVEAQREGVSKAELVLRFVRERVAPFPPLHEDPLWEFAGLGDAEPVESIDEFLYGWNAKA